MKTEEIEQFLESPREEERVEAFRLIRAQNLPVSQGRLAAGLGDASWRVRKEAVECFLAADAMGRSAAEAVALLHSEDNAGLRNAAMEILVRMGRLAIPALKAEMESADHDVRKFVVDILGEIREESSIGVLVAALGDPDLNVRAAAAENLGKLGAREAIPALLKAMETDDFAWRFTILEALAQIGERLPVQNLIRFRDDRLLRKALFDCLGRVGDLDAIPILVVGLRDDMRKCREAAALALTMLGEVFPAEVSLALAEVKEDGVTAFRVAELLEHRDRSLQEAGIRVTGWIGQGAIAQRLLPLLGDEILGPQALEALQNFGEEALCDLVRDHLGSLPEQDIFLVYLAGIGRCTDVALQIISGLDSADNQMRAVTARSLAAIGTVEAIPSLVGILDDDAEEVAREAVSALIGIGRREPQPVLSRVSALSESPQAAVRSFVVDILGALGGGNCRQHLALAVKDESPLVRQSAVRALDVLPAEDKEPLLVLALTDEDSEVRALAAETLGGVGRESVVGPLGLALGDEDLWVRTHTVRSLGRIGGSRALELVQQALLDPVGLVAIAALETLVDIDPENAGDFLRRALDHGDHEVVKTALEGLGRTPVGPWVDAVVERLIDHGQWDVRLALLTMLENLPPGLCRPVLERRLALEGDALVREKISGLLARPAVKEG